jgi:hypothetical protein
VNVATPLVIPAVPVQPEIVDFDDTLWVTLTVGLTGGVNVAVPAILVHVNTGAAALAGPAATNPTGKSIAAASNTPPTLRIVECSPLGYMTWTVYYWINEVGTQDQRRDRPIHLPTNVIVQAPKRKPAFSQSGLNRTNNRSSAPPCRLAAQRP